MGICFEVFMLAPQKPLLGFTRDAYSAYQCILRVCWEGGVGFHKIRCRGLELGLRAS